MHFLSLRINLKTNYDSLVGIFLHVLYVTMFYVYVICYYIDISRLYLKFKILIFFTKYAIIISLFKKTSVNIFNGCTEAHSCKCVIIY